VNNIRAALADYRAVAERIKAEFPGEDEENLRDTILGETYLDDTIAAVLREAGAREAMAEGLKDLIARMTQRKQRLEVTAERLKHAALWATQEAGLPPKISAPDFMASIVTPKHGKVIITSQAALPDQYIRRKVEENPDKKAIGEALGRGEMVPGAELGNPEPHWTIRR
jgi:hypothetical protein